MHTGNAATFSDPGYTNHMPEIRLSQTNGVSRMHMRLCSDCCDYLEGFIIGCCTTYNAYHTHHHASPDLRESDRTGVGACLTGLEKCITSLCDKSNEHGEEQEKRTYLDPRQLISSPA